MTGMSKPRQSRLIASAVLSAGMFMLAACTAAPDQGSKPGNSAPHADEHSGEHSGSTESGGPGSPSDDATSGKAPSGKAPSEGAAPAPDPEPAKLPKTCAELVPADALVPELRSFDNRANSWASTMIDPKTYAAVVAGEPRLRCGWGVPESDVIAVVAVAVITPTAKKNLTETLDASVFDDASAKFKDAELTLDAAYERPPAKDAPYMSTVLLDGSVLVAVSQTAQGDFAGEAMRSIQRLNAG